MFQAGRAIARAFVIVLALVAASSAVAQKTGGTLKVHFFDSPAGMSIHEETTIAAQGPMMGIFNNLVMYDQSVPQTSMNSVIPDLATKWSWDATGTALTFALRVGVKWHDGKPFTARDVKCTWDLLIGAGTERLRVNPRKAWYGNLREITTNGDHEVTFHMNRPQPAFITMLASGFSVVYPCHIPTAQMRQNPVGTGPFKFGEFKRNEVIRVVRNPDYWKPNRPFLDGIEWVIIKSISTASLTFVANKVDMTCQRKVEMSPGSAKLECPL